MGVQEGRRFRRSFCGYNRSAVDAEFNRLIGQTEELIGDRDSLRSQVDALNNSNSAMVREQARLNETIASVNGHVVELENNLSYAKSERDTLVREVEAHKAEKNALQIRYEQLKERDHDYSLREREFFELQNSVSSIMSVTKRATDRLFQKVVENQERVTQIAGDAAREIASIRSDMVGVRQKLNEVLDEMQDRIDRVDASLTGAVHKLVAIKHDDGLQTADNKPDILNEVERLLSMKPGDSDNSDGTAYTLPVLGPYSTKFIADTAQRVNDGRITPKPNPRDGIEVRRAMPTAFETSDTSRMEANKLLERGGITAEEYYSANPQFVPDAPVYEETDEAVEEVEEVYEEESSAIPMPPPIPTSNPIGFAPYEQENYIDPFAQEDTAEDDTQSTASEDYFDNAFGSTDAYSNASTERVYSPFFDDAPTNEGNSYIGDRRSAAGHVVGSSAASAQGSYQMGSYSFQPYDDATEEQETTPVVSNIVKPKVRINTNGKKKVAVCAKRRAHR